MQEHIKVIPEKCRACRRCEMACIAAHNGITLKEAMKRRDELATRAHVVKTDEFKASLRCHQCDPAPCCAICPTGALTQVNGVIIAHEELCAACKMCMAVCPYGAISMGMIGLPDLSEENSETIVQRARREVAVRCDMCTAWRLVNDKKITACVEACPAAALSLVLPDGTQILPPPPQKPAKEAGDGAAPAATEAAPTQKPAKAAAAKSAKI